ncbi:MAG: nitroreductase family protein [Bilophila wadsworthia]
MNDFLSLAQKRYAVRSYLPKPVEAEKLERILEAGRVAPTAKNTQPFRFLVVQHPERLKKLSACTNVKGYPLAIIVCSVASEVWVRPFDGKSKPDTDAAIAATHMLLEATDLGLGSCWLMHFDPAPIREQFRIPEGELNTSSPSVTRRKIRTPPSGTPRKPLEDLVVEESSRKRLRGRGPSGERGLS